MKLSFSTLACPRWSWDEIVSTAADLLYDGIEIRGVGNDISVPSVPAFSNAKLPNTLERLSSLNLSIPCLDSDCCIYLKETEESTLKEVQAYIELANKMKVPYIRVMPSAPVPHIVDNIDEQYVKDQAIIIANMAENYNVTILLETHGIWSDTNKMSKLMQDVGHKNLGVLWDIHHPYRFMNETPTISFDNLKDYVKHVHVKDGVLNKQGQYKYAMPGLGSIPIKECVDLLISSGYNGYFSLEWVKRWDMSLEEPGVVLEHYVNYMKKL